MLLQILHTVGLRMLSPDLDKQGLLTSYDWVTENICFFWRGNSLAEHSIVLLCMCIHHIAALIWNGFMENSQSERVGDGIGCGSATWAVSIATTPLGYDMREQEMANHEDGTGQQCARRMAVVPHELH